MLANFMSALLNRGVLLIDLWTQFYLKSLTGSLQYLRIYSKAKKCGTDQKHCSDSDNSDFLM